MSARHDWWPCVTTVARRYRHRVGRPDLSPRVVMEVEAVETALARYDEGSPQRALIQRRLAGATIVEAAVKTGYSVDHARRINREFLYQVAKGLGYE